ncbi:hypothetical protein HYPSUDRAFT_189591 [Hypholoma sublateritium FD-334 SS-4]|uniref:glutathione transferase n=1 Tax=Hypholoma sublateritium (strain FD-334 SS-4) TaxID=945553 RepID=A0A0D2NLQ2_HYPSF|nr:hypothetical protein HYPSUDRAFT_189591 [Hypholoma sublateritium FD-334 SS-4]
MAFTNLKLYGRPLSSATRRAAVILIEKKVPFEFVLVPNREHKAPEYLKKHPFGQIPLIEEPDGFRLYESRAIGRYIAEKYASQGTPLLPTELKAKAIFEQAASSELANFDFLASQAVKEVIGKKREGLTPDYDRFNEIYSELSAKLDAYEIILSKQKYIAGDEITLVDLFHIPFGSSLVTIVPDVFEKRPNVSRWWNDISSRPSWQSVKEGVHSTA